MLLLLIIYALLSCYYAPLMLDFRRQPAIPQPRALSCSIAYDMPLYAFRYSLPPYGVMLTLLLALRAAELRRHCR